MLHLIAEIFPIIKRIERNRFYRIVDNCQLLLGQPMKTSTLFPVYGPRSYRFVRRILEEDSAFWWSLSHPKDAQEKTLASLLKCLRGTAIEKSMSENIRGLQEFRSAIPIQSYDDVAPFVERILYGENRVLSREKVLGFVKDLRYPVYTKIDTDYGELVVFYKTSTIVLGTWFTQRFPSISQGDICHIVSSATERHSSNGLPIGANTGRMVDALPKGFQKKFVLAGIPEITDPDLRHYVHLRLALQKSVRMLVTANPSTIALYGRKLTEYKDFLAKICSKVP